MVGVSKTIGSVAILHNISLRLERGEFFSLLGPSGCGKTTLLRIVAGLITPSSGSVSIGGSSMQGVAPNRRPVGMIFQHLALFPHLDVYNNVAFGLKLQRLPRREVDHRVRSALELVDLAPLERRRIHELSGGQKQRVAISRALVLRPAALLLDEPFGALDVQLRLRLQIELKRIQRELGMTFVYVTHDQSEAFAMADRIGVMHHGRLLQVGTPAELYRSPTTMFVADFLGEANVFEGVIEASDEGNYRIKSGSLTLRAWGPPDLSGPVRCVLRPERVAIGPRAIGQTNHHTGVVVSAQFLGASTAYLIRLDTGHPVRVRAYESAFSDLREDAAVDIAWSPDDMTLVHEPQGAS